MTIESYAPGIIPPADMLARFRVAQTLRQNWESLWRECRDYTQSYTPQLMGGMQKNSKLFDGTAGNAADQLASSLLAQLTPPWSSWIGLSIGPMANEEETSFLTPLLQEANEIIQGHFDRSNFAVEMHQAFLDLVTYGTACMRFDETDPGELSAFHFQTTPLTDIYFLDSLRGQLDICFCNLSFSTDELLARFPQAAEHLNNATSKNQDQRHTILYAIIPHPQNGYILSFILNSDTSDPILLEQLRSNTSPFIGFRHLSTHRLARGERNFT